ncbi:protein mono-ADP-ribosyltransferase PARP14-like isoform X2 [Gigantopelta aegis]|uniref:protein mono-ADP-ribosyltransferase PARP14-like isoform X2 n=1 Tax=Gigantopelta aegis TaxID=1735272 RepID=UPI001B88884D|nr:protein mono-ADP-ribosyltransferase PARP14-like isoform X2 [Gigantopelta aegis]
MAETESDEVEIYVVKGDITEQKVISRAVLACLHHVNHSYESIVFPVIGFELYSPDIIAQSMFEAVLDFEEEHTSTRDTPTLKTVVFAICTSSQTFDDFVLEIFDEQYHQNYEDANSAITTSLDASDLEEDGASLMDETDSPAGLSRLPFRDSFLTSDGPVLPTSGRPKGHPSQQLRPLSKKKKKRKKKNKRQQPSIFCPIVIGNIAHQVADVIVCSVGENLNLSRAAAASAVLRVGGRDLQKYLHEKYPHGCEPTQIATTIRCGSLQCEDVYCAILSKKENAVQNIKDLETVITKCLLHAHNTKRNSLAFPALGTGKLKKKYQVDAVAMCMFETVHKFALEHRRTSIKSVMFVLRESDKSVQEAFRKESKLHPSRTNTMASLTTNVNRASLVIEDAEWPATWESMGNKTYALVKLSEECLEYENILSSFETSMPEDTYLIKVERIQNQNLYTKYKAAKKTMERKNSKITNENILWHGTNGEVVESICINGFNRCYRGRNGTRYGEGTYFARSASLSHGFTSPDYQEYRHMFQTCVLTGQFTTGERGMLEPPCLPDEVQRFDSTVDNLQDPTIYVCFYDTHTYPQYLITYSQDGPTATCSVI